METTNRKTGYSSFSGNLVTFLVIMELSIAAVFRIHARMSASIISGQ